MRLNKITLLLIVISGILFFSCKKKTTIKVRVYNYSMGEPLSGAKVDLVQKKEVGSLSGSTSNCEVVVSAVTDANGYCVFDDAKLKIGSRYEYFLGVSNAYGITQTYPCGGKTSGFIDVGENNVQTLNASYFDGYIKIQYRDLLNPSQSGDSILVRVTSATYLIPNDSYPAGGGGVLIASSQYGSSGFPYPSIYPLSSVKTQCGKKIVSIRKRKLGVLTTSIDTVLVRPNEETLFEIQW